MWSLLPQIVDCYEEFGVDRMEDMEVPLQNYISRGSDVLISSQEPNYLSMVANPSPLSLADSSKSADPTNRIIQSLNI